MKQNISLFICITSLLLVLTLHSQDLAQGQKEMLKFLDNAKFDPEISSENLQLNYFDINSEIAQHHTRELRAAQVGMVPLAGDEDIVFCMNDGIWVQYANGSGRRHLIARGVAHSFFSYPAWSIDGKKMAFAANRVDSRVVDLVVANADGSDASVILTLSEGYFNSYIWSISWSWDSNYIMFSYAYNDINLNSLFVVCTIQGNGTNFVVGPGPDRSFCQYEPIVGSSRYAYISAGRPFYFNTDLRVSNLNGSNDILWWQLTGSISGFTHIAWNNANSIYTIIRNWDQYPNKEVLIRFDRAGQNTSNTLISFSDAYASLWSPTVSPDRKYLYDSELYSNNTSALWLTQLSPTISVTAKGAGAYPNWRQNIPVVQAPDKVMLLNPQHNSLTDGRRDMLGFWVTFSWNSAARAEKYSINVFNEAGATEHAMENITQTNVELMLEQGKKYTWRVKAVNAGGDGLWSDTWSFSTVPSAIDHSDHIVTEYELKQNVPNPFNPTTIIEFLIPKAEFVTLKIFDINGKHIQTLVSGSLSAGTHFAEWNGSEQPSGVYFYQILTEGFKQTKKFVLTR